MVSPVLNSSLEIPLKGFTIKGYVLPWCGFLQCGILGPVLVCGLGDQGQPERHFLSFPWVWYALFLEVCVAASHIDLARHLGDVLHLATPGSLNNYNAFPKFPVPSSIWLWGFSATREGGLLVPKEPLLQAWRPPASPAALGLLFIVGFLWYLFSFTFQPLLPSGHRSLRFSLSWKAFPLHCFPIQAIAHSSHSSWWIFWKDGLLTRM